MQFLMGNDSLTGRLGSRTRGVLRNQRGLTLIELLVVVAILGALAALVVPKVMETLNEANRKVAVADAGTVRQAMERYLVDHRDYPPDMKKTGEQTDSYEGLAEKLAPYLNLPPASQASFTFVSYSKQSDPPYSLVLKAKDRDQTQITVTPAGVTTP